jgi:hypothetical protein
VGQAIGTGRISSGADLTSSSYTDQQARQSLLDFMRRNANRTGADSANFVAQFRRGGGYADRSVDRNGGSTLSSARFDRFSVPTRRLARVRIPGKATTRSGAWRPPIPGHGDQCGAGCLRAPSSGSTDLSVRGLGQARRWCFSRPPFAALASGTAVPPAFSLHWQPFLRIGNLQGLGLVLETVARGPCAGTGRRGAGAHLTCLPDA